MESQTKPSEQMSVGGQQNSLKTSINIDINELMDEIDSHKDLTKESNAFNGNVNYDSLLWSISDTGKLMDRNDLPDTGNSNQCQDLTADLFANMSDSEILNHFIPVRGIDFDRSQGTDDQLKKEKKEKDADCIEPVADEFKLHGMMPHINPVYHLNPAYNFGLNHIKASAFKSPASENVQIGDTEEQQEEMENESTEHLYLDMENDYSITGSGDSIKDLDEEKFRPRKIKRRKPRTYNYNPKPLQHKESRSFVPDDLKDIDYWAHRKRNNEAAKKSRVERRKKELEILNNYGTMKQEYAQIKIENVRLKVRNSMLEKQVSDLQCQLKSK